MLNRVHLWWNVSITLLAALCAEKTRRQHAVPSNDDLLYDPDLDEEDQRWIDHHRQRYIPKVPPGRGQGRQSGKTDVKRPKPMPRSDAVLNCPACMTLLCLDCQK